MDGLARRVRDIVNEEAHCSWFENLFQPADDILELQAPSGVNLWFSERVGSALGRGLTFDFLSRKTYLTATYENSKQGLYFGKIALDNGNMDGLLVQRWPSQWIAVAAACFRRTSLPAPLLPQTNVDARIAIQKQGNKSSSKFSWSSLGNIIGHQYMRRWSLTSQDGITVGGEVYYTASETSGGLSLGFQWKHSSISQGESLVASLGVNPLMGHLRCAFSQKSPLSKYSLAMATQYEMNFYSFDADVAAGIGFTSKPDSIDGLNVSFSWRKGLSFSLTSRILNQGNSRLRLGVSTGPLDAKHTAQQTESLSLLPSYQKSASIGFELIFEH